jgi:hypothetical protein
MTGCRRREEAQYRLREQGTLPPQWSAWFEGLSISHEAPDDTVLAGKVADQAALYGVISRVRDLGLTLVAIERVDGDADGRSGEH